MPTGTLARVLAASIFATIAMQCEDAAPEIACVLTAEEKAANARLTFEEFDQRGIRPSTARQLGSRGCHREAAEASEHYLIHGPVSDVLFQRALMFHQGQYLALSGEERAAARIIAGTKDPAQPEAAELDWNSYVEGTWAFLTKDLAGLEAASSRLSADPGPRNASNARVLRGLVACFDESYDDAYSSPECRGP